MSLSQKSINGLDILMISTQQQLFYTWRYYDLFSEQALTLSTLHNISVWHELSSKAIGSSINITECNLNSQFYAILYVLKYGNIMTWNLLFLFRLPTIPTNRSRWSIWWCKIICIDWKWRTFGRLFLVQISQ